MDGKTKIMCWNANGILTRHSELEYFLHSQSIDIALIAETQLISTNQLRKLNGYKVYNLSIICVNLFGASINIGSIYCSLAYNIKKDEFEDVLESLGERWLIGGDLNANIPCEARKLPHVQEEN